MIKTRLPLDQHMQDCLDSLNSRADGVDEQDLVRFLFLDRLIGDLLTQAGADFEPESQGVFVRKLLRHDLSEFDTLQAAIAAETAPTEEAVFPLGRERRKKLAYPDASYMLISPQYRQVPEMTSKWIAIHNTAAQLRATGVDEREALKRAIRGLSREDALAFLTWYGIKMKSDANLKYLVAGENVSKLNKTADYGAGEELDSDFAYHFYNQTRQPAATAEEVKPEPAADPAALAEFKSMRDKMIGRTFAIDKLLERHQHLLSADQVDRIEDSLNTLRKNIRRLKAASLKDSITKTAGIATKSGWLEGAAMISAIADTDAGFSKVASAVGQTDQVRAVLDSLQSMSTELRQRELIRQMAARDIDLFNLGYGHLTEVGDASAKLMEAYNSAANKLDDVIGRLRADIQRASDHAPPTVNTIVDPQDLPLAKALSEPAPAATPAAIPPQMPTK